MESWKDFEKECYRHLVSTYGHLCRFEALGESDSTNSDIRVTTSRDEQFFLETKESLAQCGQFVLHPDAEGETFIYSSQNKSPLNPYSQAIITHMNEHYSNYAKAGTGGKIISLPDDVFYGWIKTYYGGKNVRFFMTRSKEYIILPVERFADYFSVIAKYRIKKSGSCDPSGKNFEEISQVLQKKGCEFRLFSEGKQWFVSTRDSLHGAKLSGTRYTYQFKRQETGLYRIRRLSNTKHANVIFSIALKKEQEADDLRVFENAIG